MTSEGEAVAWFPGPDSEEDDDQEEEQSWYRVVDVIPSDTEEETLVTLSEGMCRLETVSFHLILSQLFYPGSPFTIRVQLSTTARKICGWVVYLKQGPTLLPSFRDELLYQVGQAERRSMGRIWSDVEQCRPTRPSRNFVNWVAQNEGQERLPYPVKQYMKNRFFHPLYTGLRRKVPRRTLWTSRPMAGVILGRRLSSICQHLVGRPPTGRNRTGLVGLPNTTLIVCHPWSVERWKRALKRAECTFLTMMTRDEYNQHSALEYETVDAILVSQLLLQGDYYQQHVELHFPVQLEQAQGCTRFLPSQMGRWCAKFWPDVCLSRMPFEYFWWGRVIWSDMQTCPGSTEKRILAAHHYWFAERPPQLHIRQLLSFCFLNSRGTNPHWRSLGIAWLRSLIWGLQTHHLTQPPKAIVDHATEQHLHPSVPELQLFRRLRTDPGFRFWIRSNITEEDLISAVPLCDAVEPCFPPTVPEELPILLNQLLFYGRGQENHRALRALCRRFWLLFPTIELNPAENAFFPREWLQLHIPRLLKQAELQMAAYRRSCYLQQALAEPHPERNCPICLESCPSPMWLDCGHCLCHSCLLRITRCPLCQRYIERVIVLTPPIQQPLQLHPNPQRLLQFIVEQALEEPLLIGLPSSQDVVFFMRSMSTALQNHDFKLLACAWTSERSIPSFSVLQRSDLLVTTTRQNPKFLPLEIPSFRRAFLIGTEELGFFKQLSLSRVDVLTMVTSTASSASPALSNIAELD